MKTSSANSPCTGCGGPPSAASAIGLGGLFFPRGLGVGYDNIAILLAGHATLALIFGVIVFKSLMWAFSLGSGTSGGVLAPLLMIGASLGALSAHLLHMPEGTLALIGMGAMLAGALGSPLTAIVFSIELTHALPALLPLVVACIAAYTITSLIMPRSILTEKLGRRGHHLTREYGVDPLEMVSVEDAMTDVADVTAAPVAELPAVYTFSDETCRSAAERMATTGHIRLAVVDRETMQPLGYVSLQDLLIGRRRFVKREEARERVFRLASSRATEQDPVVTREERPVEHARALARVTTNPGAPPFAMRRVETTNTGVCDNGANPTTRAVGASVRMANHPPCEKLDTVSLPSYDVSAFCVYRPVDSCHRGARLCIQQIDDHSLYRAGGFKRHA